MIEPVIEFGEALTILVDRVCPNATFSFAEAFSGKKNEYIWAGKVLDGGDGGSWIPAILPAEELRKAVAKEKALGKPDPEGRVRKYHASITKDAFSLSPWAYVEVDHLPIHEQRARYLELSSITGLNWCMQVHSGGKSIHAYMAFSVPIPANSPLRYEIQKLLIVALEGDSKITDAGRMMRFPGWKLDRRLQPIIQFDGTAHYPAQEIHDRLLSFCRDHLGVVDVDQAFLDLKAAEIVAQHAKNAKGSEADDLLDLADQIRKDRGSVSQSVLSAVSEIKRIFSERAGHTFSEGEVGTLDPALMGKYSGLRIKSRVAPPCCPEDAHAGVVQAKGIFCHRCKRTHLYETPKPIDFGSIDEIVEATPLDLLPPKVHGPQDANPIESVDLFVEKNTRIQVSQQIDDELLMLDILGLEAPNESTLTQNSSGDTLSIQGENGGASLLRSYIDCNPHYEQTPTFLEAKQFLKELSMDAHYCQMGPWQHAAVGVYATLSQRLPCNAYSCTLCGPRVKTALAGSLLAILKEKVVGKSFEGIQFQIDPESPAWKSFVHHSKRWIKEGHRGFVGIAGPQIMNVIMYWNTENSVPFPKALASVLATAIPLKGYEIAVAAKDLAMQAEIQAWRDSGAARITLLRGDEFTKRAVSLLRDQVLGRARATKKPKDPSRAVYRSKTSASELQAAAEEMLQIEAEIIDSEENYRGRTHTVSWRQVGVPSQAALDKLASEGHLPKIEKKVRTPKSKPLGEGFVDLEM